MARSRPDKAAALRAIEFEATLLARAVPPTQVADRPRLDRSAYTLLTRLMLAGPMSVAELSRAFGLDVSTVHRQTSAMLRDGLVDRIPDPDGGIARKFRISEEGQSKLDADRHSRLSGLAAILAEWPTEDVAVLARMLGRFNDQIEQFEGRPWPTHPDSHR